jgi:16S rRNA (guanine(1405)-N(7))-methyltransferase
MNKVGSQQIDRLIEAVLASSKYKSVHIDFIRYIGTQELTRQHNLKDAIKSTKNKLHQVGGAYQTSTPRYSVWLDELKYAKRSGNKAHFLYTCKWIMEHHSSTRERLPVLEQFYSTILADLPPINSVIDVACGLHPLAIPWMPLSEYAQYYAYDIYEDMIGFLNDCIALMPVQGYGKASDVIHNCPAQKVDVAFILKAIPCLEQVDKSAGSRLLETINADHLVVSFPAHSLGGKNKGMATNYETRFYEQVANKPWSIQRFVFPGELVFLISKSKALPRETSRKMRGM